MKYLRLSGMTFVEILVVVLIITLISGAWFFYLSKFLSSSAIGNDVKLVNDFLDNLDARMKKYDLLMYQVDFAPWNGFSYLTDVTSDKYASFQTVDFTTGNCILNTFWASGEAWTLKFFLEDMYKNTQNYSSSSTPVIKLFSSTHYALESYFSWVFSNFLGLIYYSEDNFGTNANKFTSLTSINSQSDNKGVNYATLRIINKNGNKKMYTWANEISEAYLFFQKGEDTSSIHITK